MYFRFVLTATATAALVVGSATVGDAAVLSPTPRSSSHAADGTVYASVQVGSRLFVGGSFTSVDGTRRGASGSPGCRDGPARHLLPCGCGRRRALLGQ